MRKIFLALFSIFFTLFASPAFAIPQEGTPAQESNPAREANSAPEASPAPEAERVIVEFKPSVSSSQQDDSLSKVSAQKIKKLKIVNAQVAHVSRSRKEQLENDPRVLRVEKDVQVYTLCHRRRHACPTPTPSPAPSPSPTPLSTQTIPWGIDRIDADLIWTTTTANPIKVAVIDTGIQLNHPDLIANVKGGINTINPTKSATDDNGHGTHVAGIIAALNNTTGVIGVGPDIDLYAIKVLDSSGSGWVSDIIEGLQWSSQNGMQIVNMSLGTTTDVQAFHDAVIAAKNAGVTLVAAAGNSGPSDNSVIYPAKYTEVIAVAATDQSDNLTSWSSRGPEVDIYAPGSSIYSTYKRSTYKVLSGTSMASPHVAGVAALILATHPSFTPDQIKAHIENTAEPIIASKLVDAQNAVNTP